MPLQEKSLRGPRQKAEVVGEIESARAPVAGRHRCGYRKKRRGADMLCYTPTIRYVMALAELLHGRGGDAVKTSL